MTHHKLDLTDYFSDDNWYPACSGLEKPFTVNGVRWLYVWNPAKQVHGYLNLDTDIVETDVNFKPGV